MAGISSGWSEARIVSVAKKMLSGDMGIVEGSRLINGVSGRDDDLLDIFMLIASETEDFPVGDLRSLWEKGALERIERRTEAYIDQLRDEVLKTCEMLIQKYSAREEGEEN